jgi:hypothetical protein
VSARFPLLIALLCAALLPWPARAQQPADLPDRQLAYQAARSAYQAARDAWSVAEKAWNDAVDEHARARRAADQARQDIALTRALDLARELEMHERRVTDQQGGLDDARTALLGAIAQRVAMLEGQRADARSTAEANRIAAVLRDLENQRDELEAEAEGATVRTTLVYYESIQYDPRDDRESLASKAELLRSKAEQADSLIVQIDREIERIGRQVRRSRNAQSLVTGVERFGDIQAPGAPGRRIPPDDVRARPDSAGVARPEPTPEQRVLELRLLRGELESAKRSFLQRAATFDALLRRLI